MKDFLYMKIGRNLKGNICQALVLLFISIMSYLIFCLVYKIFVFTIIQILLNYKLLNLALFIEKYELYINLIFIVFIISPLNLSVKNWYYNLNETTKTSLTFAFVVYESFRNYFKTVVFCFIKAFIIILNCIVFMLPSAFVLSIFKYMILTNYFSNTITTIILFIVFILLIIGLIACLFNFIYFIFVDYMFLRNINNKLNIFYYYKIIKYSKELAILNSKQLFLTILKLSPFAIFSFKSGIAIHIKETLK